MKKLKYQIKALIVSIVLLLRACGGDVVYAQNEWFDWFGKRGGLPILVSNPDTVWIAFYPAIGTVADTINPLTTQHLFNKRPSTRLRQTGPIYQAGMYIHDASDVTTLIIELWRPDNTFTNSSIITKVDETDNLQSLLTDGVNLIPVSLTGQEGDFIAVYYEGTINGIQMTDGVVSDSTKRFTTKQTTANLNVSTGTAYANSFNVRLYGPAPVVSLIGNSMIDGAGNATPGWASGTSHIHLQTYNRVNQIGYMFSQNNYTYQNMGISSQGVVTMQPRFETDITDENGRIAIIMGATNDIQANFYSVVVSDAIKEMIDSAVAHDMITYYIGIPPRNGFTINKQKTADSVNTILEAYCLTKPNCYYIDTRRALGEFNDSGTVDNMWNLRDVYNGSDYLHPSFNGNGKIAGMIFGHNKTQYAVNDTVESYLLTSTALTDTVKPDLTSLGIGATAYCLFGIDSLNFEYKINSGAVISEPMNFKKWTSSYTGMTFTDTVVIDTSTVSDGDVISYRYTIYGYKNNIPAWRTITISDRDYEPEYLALYERYDTKPPAFVTGIQNRLVYNLKLFPWSYDSTKTLWNTRDVVYVLGTSSEDNSLENWIADSLNCVNVGGYTFTVNQGYEGPTGYLNTTYLPLTDAVNYTQNSASIGIYCIENVQENTTDVGASTGYLQLRLGTNTFAYLVNGGSSVGSITDSRGWWVGTRIASNSIFAFHNVDSLHSATTGAGALPNANITIGAYGGGFNSSRKIVFVQMGAGLSKQDCLNMGVGVNAYMTELGINTY